MKILACDTSNRACSCALIDEGSIVGAKFINNGLTHSQTFMPLVHDLMEENTTKYEELDAVACTVGPGSFTGIRIGVSAVKTMAMALEIAAVPVSSLRAMAYPLRGEDALIVPMIDCRNHRAWAGGFYRDEEVVSELASDITEILEKCRAWRDANLPGKKIVLIGNGAKVAAKDLFGAESAAAGEPAGEDFAIECREEHEDIRSEDVAAIAEKIIKETGTSAFGAEKLMSVYRAKTQAERMADEQGKQVENIPIRYYSTMEDKE